MNEIFNFQSPYKVMAYTPNGSTLENPDWAPVFEAGRLPTYPDAFMQDRKAAVIICDHLLSGLVSDVSAGKLNITKTAMPCMLIIGPEMTVIKADLTTEIGGTLTIRFYEDAIHIVNEDQVMLMGYMMEGKIVPGKLLAELTYFHHNQASFSLMKDFLCIEEKQSKKFYSTVDGKFSLTTNTHQMLPRPIGNADLAFDRSTIVTKLEIKQEDPINEFTTI